MTDLALIEARYASAGYITENPPSNVENPPWQLGKVRELLEANLIVPKSIVDVGCSDGDLRMKMLDADPNARLTEYEIAPDAEHFGTALRDAGIDLVIGNFLVSSISSQNIILLLDVVGHLRDLLSLLSKLKGHVKYYVSHFPLILSAVSVLRKSLLLFVCDKVGHVNYYKRGLVLALLKEYGYRSTEARFTGAAFNAPGRGWRTILTQMLSRLAFALERDLDARFYGGEPWIVLAVDAEAK